MSYALYNISTGVITNILDTDDTDILNANLEVGQASVSFDPLQVEIDDSTHYVVGGVLTPQGNLSGVSSVTSPSSTTWKADGISTWTLSGIPVGSLILFTAPVGVIEQPDIVMSDTVLILKANPGCHGEYSVTIDAPTKLSFTTVKSALE
jgi:hypothetical protein